MRVAGLLIALLLAHAAPAAAAGEIYTLAGTGTDGPVREGGAATRAGLGTDAQIAPLAAGGFLVADADTVRRVDVRGRIHTVAKGRFFASGVAALPGGGFLVADTDHHSIRMVDPRGRISTVAGGGGSRANGALATHARLGFPLAVEALPGGGFVIADAGEDPGDDDAIVGGTIRRVGPDGRIRIVAGSGEDADFNPALDGQPATAVPISPSDVAVTGDGGLLIADYYAGRVDRVAPSGAITQAAGGVKPGAVAAQADGGFVIADNGDDGVFAAQARVLRVGPDGAMTAIAGTGRFLSNAPTGFEHRADGAAALAADLHYVSDLAALPDGGLLIAEGSTANVREDGGSLVRYVAPAAPAILAAALDRDHDRVNPTAVNVSTTLPATVTVAVGGRTKRADVQAGTARIALAASRTRPETVTLTARDRSGRGAEDHMRVYPRGWLPDETARYVATSIAPDVAHGAAPGDVLARCRRFGRSRVDCAIGKPCALVASVSLAQGRLRWGTYGCRLSARPRYRRRPRALRKADWKCKRADTACPPALFGRLGEAALVPSS